MVTVHFVDAEWLLSTLFDASLLPLEPPASAALFAPALLRPEAPSLDRARRRLRDHGAGNHSARLRQSHLDSRRVAGHVLRNGEALSMSDRLSEELHPVSF